MMFEVEQKFHLDDTDAFIKKLKNRAAVEQAEGQHVDTYFNHPSRDFAETHEALRIRRVDGIPQVTYKGPKLPGNVKAREELEWRLDPGDKDGSKTEQLWLALGFQKVALVKKHRRTFTLTLGSDHSSSLTVTVDNVVDLGMFVEVERVVESAADVEQARLEIVAFSQKLGLIQPESRSYLRMLLELSPS